MEKIKGLNTYQKGILLLMAAYIGWTVITIMAFVIFVTGLL